MPSCQAPKRRRARVVSVREPFVLRAGCPHCGSPVVVANCAACDEWFTVCDCLGDPSFDTYLSSAALCPQCRVLADEGSA